ncbi:protein ADM2 isoform X1 [Lepisosteus oculatus]|uniref:Adrenomedullin 2 n=1 Tax=Lepisosteus oculatus TaxID=7918 RepID=W5NJH8_LEPOC|nr:PREDICTED: ADM2 [Lepisosteus oculatus]
MRAFLPVTVCCISLLCLHQQLLALPVGNSLERNRLNFLKRLQDLEQFESTTPGPTASPKDSSETIVEPIRERLRLHPIYLHAFKQNSRGSSYTYDAPKVDAETDAQRKVSRGRRHAHTGARGHHPQLMRVGCVLGTCQVQNLSHRLWQLIGQSGREDSSPVNPKSPHSYG